RISNTLESPRGTRGPGKVNSNVRASQVRFMLRQQLDFAGFEVVEAADDLEIVLGDGFFYRRGLRQLADRAADVGRHGRLYSFVAGELRRDTLDSWLHVLHE